MKIMKKIVGAFSWVANAFWSIVKFVWVLLGKKQTYFVLLFILWSLSVGWFFSNYYLQSPIKILKFQPIIEKRIHSSIPDEKSQESAKNEQILPIPPVWEDNALLEDLYQQTRTLESGAGTNENPNSTHKYCQALGAINEIGYFPEGNTKYCFASELIQEGTFKGWVIKQLKSGLTVSQTMCLFVNGVPLQVCKRTIDMGL